MFGKNQDILKAIEAMLKRLEANNAEASRVAECIEKVGELMARIDDTMARVLRAVKDGDHVRVLVVDDDPELLMLLREAVEEEGIKCHTALSYDEAMKYINRWDYKMVIADYRLPDRSGVELLKNVNRVTHTAIITAYDVPKKELELVNPAMVFHKGQHKVRDIANTVKRYLRL